MYMHFRVSFKFYRYNHSQPYLVKMFYITCTIYARKYSIVNVWNTLASYCILGKIQKSRANIPGLLLSNASDLPPSKRARNRALTIGGFC